MKKLTRRMFVTGSATMFCAPSVKTEAQSSWPTRQIRILVPYPAGGQTDGIARAFGDYLARQVGKTVIVENKAGAGGVIGVAEAKRAEPDGTTILCTISSSLIQNRLTVKDLPYDPERDFIYLTMVSGAGGPVVAAKKTGAKSLREFIEYAKKVGSLNWGSYGVGSTPHVLIATMAKQYGIQFQVVQYRGEAPMWNDIAGQTLDGAAGSYAAAAPVIQAGTGNLIGVVGSRLPPYPDTPTMTEQGAVGDFYDLRAFTTFAVPTGTPQDIVQRISELLIQAGSDSKVQQMLNNFILSSPANLETTARIFKRDSDVMLGILRDLGVKPSE
ncbi:MULTISPECIES: tripartite tricarboxylate transporter substrate binding protein [unclassified Bradyrhizobium]|uniref:Bug family tripartite tricarboxylate transporter substrate binding protein n=2 Tax=Bradyrhizobium TaxID=374 RepID=UPI001BAE0603|nr:MULTISPECIES: tripartite tricarboxylate transporter substrate binding protein [unclassified Bradyrhizobium]MBR1226326.1 tripartite tricarboxylate transporter substrate binding protein [Bradyrhizobium sp. AUGA SZCCT0176]MBR1295261.1 tripartite tricarboxylate transporter substrate binding protein [Bradyrhizobium sp. AUGA SZCCT0042]